ncbi:hypothetical protein PR048_030307 [Dryococelus australis]|uniref:Uncharacterized protein n=1 Tax=Dryococelus australis TaxID=614101 RepID=A0ABQ9GBC0_9NEOP|nr:hypothetical protein PR048_030307 [Dryococelus australis]
MLGRGTGVSEWHKLFSEGREEVKNENFGHNVSSNVNEGHDEYGQIDGKTNLERDQMIVTKLFCLFGPALATQAASLPLLATTRTGSGAERTDKVSMEQLRNARAGETGDLREDPPTSGIVRHDSHTRKSGCALAGNRARRFASCKDGATSFHQKLLQRYNVSGQKTSLGNAAKISKRTLRRIVECGRTERFRSEFYAHYVLFGSLMRVLASINLTGYVCLFLIVAGKQTRIQIWAVHGKALMGGDASVCCKATNHLCSQSGKRRQSPAGILDQGSHVLYCDNFFKAMYLKILRGHSGFMRDRSRIFACGNRAGICCWPAGFSRGSPVPPPLKCGAAPYSHRFPVIGSQDLDGKIDPRDVIGERGDRLGRQEARDSKNGRQVVLVGSRKRRSNGLPTPQHFERVTYDSGVLDIQRGSQIMSRSLDFHYFRLFGSIRPVSDLERLVATKGAIVAKMCFDQIVDTSQHPTGLAAPNYLAHVLLMCVWKMCEGKLSPFPEGAGVRVKHRSRTPGEDGNLARMTSHVGEKHYVCLGFTSFKGPRSDSAG